MKGRQEFDAELRSLSESVFITCGCSKFLALTYLAAF